MRLNNITLFIALFFIKIVAVGAVEIHFESPSALEIKDAVLFTSKAGSCDFDTVALGNLGLSDTDHQLELNLDYSVDSAWLLGSIDSEIILTSSNNLNGLTLEENNPFKFSELSFAATKADVLSELEAFTAKSVMVRIGVMSDTHYYRNPDGTPHPLEQKDPIKYDLTANLGKMQAAMDEFDAKEVDFSIILGDMVEDHAGWAEGSTWPAYGGFTPDAALYSNLGDIENLFDQYSFPMHLIIGNHDTGFGTTRTDLYNTMSYYSQESYDDNAYAKRMDYTFDVNGVRFVAFDNVGQVEVAGAQQGYRWASADTLGFLTDELAKVSDTGINAGMPIVLMSHARVDCLSENNCNQKVDLLDSSKYQWQASSGGTNEYYLVAASGGEPDIFHTGESYNQFIWFNNLPFQVSSVGSLKANTWDYGSNSADAISFNTIYIRLAEPTNLSYDPDAIAISDYIQYKYVEAGMSENFEEQRMLFESAQANGANILAVLQGHHHISAKNDINNIEYFTFSSPKTVPKAHAILEILFDGSIYIDGYGTQTTYNTKKPYHEHHDCLTSQAQINSELWDNLVKSHADHAVNAEHDYPMNPVWRFGPVAQQVSSLSVDLHSSGNTYESAQDGSTSRWQIYDNDPAGAVVTNVFDISRQSRVINFDGASWMNGYALRNDALGEWRDASKSIIQWSSSFDDTYIIRVKVKTDQGNRYLRYTAVDYDDLGTESTVNFGIGSETKDGQWRTFVRDLTQDLNLAQPGLEILEVNAFFVQGDGRVDDVKLYNVMPPLDTDGDGISDLAENTIYYTDPALFDSDGDGINDGVELIFWADQWNADADNDSIINILDQDADNDGVSDGAEQVAGTNPADSASVTPPIVYEDGEDGLINRWVIYDNDPAGAIISNVFDTDRQSKVINFDGSSWMNGYALRNDGLQEWNDDSGRSVLEWSMKYSETYIITAKVLTTVGARYLRYTAVDNDGLGSTGTVNFGLGSGTQDGQWRTFVRDLQQDLSLAQPGVEILKVNAFLVQGTGRVDDVKLHHILPPPTVYEDAEDVSISRWEIYDNTPGGAVINNVFDADRQSRVMDFNGASWTNGYALRNSSSQEWHDDSGKQVLEWSMKYSETYIITAKVMTTAGARYLRYTAVDNSALGTGQTVNFALGSNTQDGQWRSYTRDLQQDLALAQPGVEILEVNAFFVQGSGRVDDVKLHYISPPLDSDGDGLSDDDETNVYSTDPTLLDSDGDGINDGDELTYWSGQWNADSDADTIINLLDRDSDNDGASDGVERDAGTDPTNPVSVPVSTVYEDAEDVSISRWEIYDNTPGGAVINNVFDADRQSRVMDFNGASWTNGYALRNSSSQEWHDDSGKQVLEWSMKYSETYIITAKVMTTAGARYLRYTAVDNSALGTGQTVNFALGSNTQDGQWRSYTRDLQQDLALAQPGVEILEVNAFFVQGSGRVDDVKLHYISPPLDSDGDGLSDDDETNVYSTDPTLLDSDGDGINDGDELTYWSGQWNADSDADTIINLLDRDSDNDGASDGVERDAGTDPTNPVSVPVSTVYEDAEDVSISRWEIYDNTPGGAVINNVFDADRQSRVMDFNGASWTNGYALRNSSSQEWHDDSGKQVLEWSMKYSETYIITAKVMTTAGARYLRYTAVDNSALGTGQTVNFALGSNTQDGQWRSYTRDLQQDLALAQPGIEILEVNAFFVQGSGRVDNVILSY